MKEPEFRTYEEIDAQAGPQPRRTFWKAVAEFLGVMLILLLTLFFLIAYA